jgi:hypothetical protein
MKIKIIIILIVLNISVLISQQAGIVIYKTSMNGKELTDEPKIKFEYSGGIARISLIISDSTGSGHGGIEDEASYIDYNSGKTYQNVLFKDGRRYTTIDSFASYPKPELTDETQTILGYMCRKATVVIRSNKIDLWYTTGAELKGTPGLNLGPELGFVLKVVRNGNYEIEAQDIRDLVVGDSSTSLRTNNGDKNGINTVDAFQNVIQNGEFVSIAEYRYRVTENNYQTFRIFDREKINFGDTIVNPPDDMENVTYRYSKGTVLLKKIRLPENITNHFVFAEISEWSNGDAYDRTGSLFVIPVNKKITFLDALKRGDPNMLPVYQTLVVGDNTNNGRDNTNNGRDNTNNGRDNTNNGRRKNRIDTVDALQKNKQQKKYQGIVSTDNYEPPVELVRFFTPFGIGAYNEQVKVWNIKWEDSATYKQDITDLLQVLQGEVWIGVFIGCYDKGGHMVSVNLKYNPFELNQKETAAPKYWIKPIINTVNIMEMSGQEYGTVFLDDTLRVTVDIPKGLKSLKLRYISTGHGGWDGGDEFNPKMNEIFIDGTRIYNYIPWRSDCSTYRKYNPATGNFSIGVSSSDFSRSGWCPGTATNPVDIPIDVNGSTPLTTTGFKPGRHMLKVFIPMGKPEGSSFSAWNVSAVLIGEYK